MRLGAFEKCNGLYVWRIQLKFKPWICGNLKWQVDSGDRVAIGLDAIKCMVGDRSLSPNLLHFLYGFGCSFIMHIGIPNLSPIASPAWLSSLDLNIMTSHVWEWELYRIKLCQDILLLEKFD